VTAPRDRERTRAEIYTCCRQLMLSGDRMVELCESQATPRQEEFLHRALSEELVRREASRKARLISRAAFPAPKALSAFEYGHVRFPPGFTRADMESCEFISERINLVFYGPVGTGKTHLAIALGLKACELGMRVRFFTVTELVLRMVEARKAGVLERLVKDLKSQDLICLDEWGYVPVDKEGSQLLFRIISSSYESGSLILTTNIEFSKWGGIFTDEQMAAAMIDRLVHYGHLLIFEGPSYRMTHALMAQKG
jgi:DNA replication protein DnaC